MKKNKTSLVAVLFFVAMFFVSSCSKETETPNPTGGVEKKSAAGPSVNGQAALFLDYEGTVPGVQHFSFHASTDKNGIVTGSFESKWGVNGRVHGTIDCLSILNDGKTAKMSGTITHVSGDLYIGWGIKVGDNAWFKVQDNGEGAKAPKDSFTDLIFGADVAPCTSNYLMSLVPILNGNIQVNP